MHRREEPMVETIDAVDGLPEEEARTLSKRMWYLGWFGLPFMWFVNAYYFWRGRTGGGRSGRVQSTPTQHSCVLSLSS